MRFLSLLSSVILGLSVTVGHAVESNSVKTERTKASLVSGVTKLEAGKPAQLAIRIQHEPHWHTYWRNPGDSGIPTSIKFELPSGAAAGAIQWPAPMHLPLPPLASFGYEGDTYLPITVTPDATLASAGMIKAKADWLVCKDICVPESAEFTLPFKVADSGASPHATPIEQALARVPKPDASIKTAAYVEPNKVTLTFDGVSAALTASGPQKKVRFYPFGENAFEALPDQPLMKTKTGYALELKRMDASAESLAPLNGVLAGVITADVGLAPSGVKAIELSAPMTVGAPPAGLIQTGSSLAPSGNASGPSSDLPQSLGLALLFAIAGGVLLNIMPCVFPVLGIKVMSFVENAHENTSMIRTQGLLFLAGVLVSFWVLAGLLLALRAAGQQLGWGFQLQSPFFVALLALLFMAIALNLSGVFEFGTGIAGKAGEVRGKNIKSDAFFSGVLATAVATPCTAPLLGAALGYTLTQPAAISLLVFSAMGLGMALPVVLLAFAPALIKKLPRPGAWMETFKQFMAFPLYATVAWLAWVFGQQVGIDGVFALAIAIVLLALAAWIFGRFTPRAKTSGGYWFSIVSTLALIGVAGAAVYMGSANRVAPEATAAVGASTKGSNASYWKPYDRDELNKLVAAGKPVFVDFTAAWCVSCQFNKRTALYTDSTTERMKALGITAMKADWTNYDPKITAALAELGRNALPVYALYSKGNAKPILLPELLTQSIVVDAINTHAGEGAKVAVK